MQFDTELYETEAIDRDEEHDDRRTLLLIPLRIHVLP